MLFRVKFNGFHDEFNGLRLDPWREHLFSPQGIQKMYIILMARAPPAAHGRREQAAPLQHLLGCGQLEDVKKCCGGGTFPAKMKGFFGASDG